MKFTKLGKEKGKYVYRCENRDGIFEMYHLEMQRDTIKGYFRRITDREVLKQYEKVAVNDT